MYILSKTRVRCGDFRQIDSVRYRHSSFRDVRFLTFIIIGKLFSTNLFYYAVFFLPIFNSETEVAVTRYFTRFGDSHRRGAIFICEFFCIFSLAEKLLYLQRMSLLKLYGNSTFLWRFVVIYFVCFKFNCKSQGI